MGLNGTVTSVVIPEILDGKKVSSIRNSAFYRCVSLSSITIPEGLGFIGYGAFDSCTSLTSISIPNSIKYTSIINNQL